MKKKNKRIAFSNAVHAFSGAVPLIGLPSTREASLLNAGSFLESNHFSVDRHLKSTRRKLQTDFPHFLPNLVNDEAHLTDTWRGISTQFHPGENGVKTFKNLVKKNAGHFQPVCPVKMFGRLVLRFVFQAKA